MYILYGTQINEWDENLCLCIFTFCTCILDFSFQFRLFQNDFHMKMHNIFRFIFILDLQMGKEASKNLEREECDNLRNFK